MSDVKINIEADLGDLTRSLNQATAAVKEFGGQLKGAAPKNAFDEATKAIQQTSAEVEELRKELNQYAQGSAKYKEVAQAIQDTTAKLEKQKATLKGLEGSIDHFAAKAQAAKSKVADLTAELNKTKVGTKAYKDLQKEIQAANKEQEKYSGLVDKANKGLKSSPSIFSKVGVAVKGALGPFSLIASAVTLIVEGIQKLYDNCKPLRIIVDKIKDGFGAVMAAISGGGNVEQNFEAIQRSRRAMEQYNKTIADMRNRREGFQNEMDDYNRIIDDEATSTREKQQAYEGMIATLEKAENVLKETEQISFDALIGELDKIAAAQGKSLTDEQKRTFWELIRNNESFEKSLKQAFGGAGAVIWANMSEEHAQAMNDIVSEWKGLTGDIITLRDQTLTAKNDMASLAEETAKAEEKANLLKGSVAQVRAEIQALQEKRDKTTVFGSDEYKKINDEITKLEKSIKPIEVKADPKKALQEIKDKVGSAYFEDFSKYMTNKFDSSWQQFPTDQLQEYLALYAAYLDYQKRELENQKALAAQEAERAKQQELLDARADAYYELKGAITEVAGSLGEETKAAKALQGVIAVLTVTEQGLAMAQAAKAFAEALSNSTKGDPYTTGIRVAAAAAAMTAAVIQLKNITKGYATGGIIEGQFGGGDLNLARVNAGEMILNRAQQGALFRLLDNGGNIGTGGAVQFTIRGRDLVGVLNNQTKFDNLSK